MKTTRTLLQGAVIAVTLLFGLSACQKDDSKPTPLHKEYTISPSPGSQISGSVTFTEVLNTDSVRMKLSLTGVSQDGSYPVYLRKGTSIENGEVAYDLGFVDGRNPTLNKSLPISFSDLIKYNGCIDIYRNPNDTVTLVAQSEIGANEVFKSYTMTSPNGQNQENGEIRIYKRSTGAYLVVHVDTTAFLGNDAHPARVYQADGITKEFDLSDVSPATGVSATNITDHTYDDLTKTKRVVKVFESLLSLDVTISQGTIQ